MLKRYMLLAVATVFFAFQVLTSTATAAELDDATRTVALNEGSTVTLSTQQAKEGQRLFNFACANCHIGGDTKQIPVSTCLQLAWQALTPDVTTLKVLWII